MFLHCGNCCCAQEKDPHVLVGTPEPLNSGLIDVEFGHQM